MKAMKKWCALALAGAMTCSLAACGAPSKDASAAAEGSTGENGLTTVNFQLKWLPSVQFMGFYVAQEKGYYEEEGIDLNMISGGSDIVSASQVGIGAADIGVSNLYGLLPYEEDGYPIVEKICEYFADQRAGYKYCREKGISRHRDLLTEHRIEQCRPHDCCRYEKNYRCKIRYKRNKFRQSYHFIQQKQYPPPHNGDQSLFEIV